MPSSGGSKVTRFRYSPYGAVMPPVPVAHIENFPRAMGAHWFCTYHRGADDDAYHIMEKCVAADAYADQLVITGNIDLIDSAHGFLRPKFLQNDLKSFSPIRCEAASRMDSTSSR